MVIGVVGTSKLGRRTVRLHQHFSSSFANSRPIHVCFGRWRSIPQYVQPSKRFNLGRFGVDRIVHIMTRLIACDFSRPITQMAPFSICNCPLQRTTHRRNSCESRAHQVLTPTQNVVFDFSPLWTTNHLILFDLSVFESSVSLG